MKISSYMLLCLSILSIEVNALSYMKVENILPRKGQYYYGIDVTYTNIESNDFYLLESPVNIAGNLTFLPVLGSSNVDSFFITPFLSYGFNENTSINMRTSYSYSTRRSLNPKNEETDKYFDSFYVGIRRDLCYDLCEEAFELIGTANVSLAQASKLNSGEIDFNFGKNYSLGLSSIYKSDPVLVGIDLDYALSIERNIENIHYNPPDQISISPYVDFYVNERISLIGGFTWQRASSGKINGLERTDQITKTSTALNFGLNLKLNKEYTFSTRVSSNISGNDQASISMIILYNPR